MSSPKQESLAPGWQLWTKFSFLIIELHVVLTTTDSSRWFQDPALACMVSDIGQATGTWELGNLITQTPGLPTQGLQKHFHLWTSSGNSLSIFCRMTAEGLGLLLWGNFFLNLFSTVDAPIYIPTNSVKRVPFPPDPLQNLLLADFLKMTFLTSLMLYLTVVLICISITLRDDEPLFMCLLAILWRHVDLCLLCIFQLSFFI